MSNKLRYTVYALLALFIIAAIIIGGIRDIWWMVVIFIVILAGYEIILKLIK